jgi:hypothetical protein
MRAAKVVLFGLTKKVFIFFFEKKLPLDVSILCENKQKMPPNA